MKKDFKKNLVITKKDNENFKKASQCWIYDKILINDGVNLKD